MAPGCLAGCIPRLGAGRKTTRHTSPAAELEERLLGRLHQHSRKDPNGVATREAEVDEAGDVSCKPVLAALPEAHRQPEDSDNCQSTLNIEVLEPGPATIIEFERTALIMIGYQNDYFAPDGVLSSVIEASRDEVLAKTLELVGKLVDTSVLLITTPIIFTPDYSELFEPSGILKVIKDVGAFRSGTPGSETIPEIGQFGDRVMSVPGKRGLNAFTGTMLEQILRQEGITDVVLCGAVTSVCIDSTGRAAHERGFRVHQLSDCTCGRTTLEQEHYTKEIFPIYADVSTTKEVLDRILDAERRKQPEMQVYRPPSPQGSSRSSIRRKFTRIYPELPFARTAVVLIGYQNDYFSPNGALRGVVEASCESVLSKTMDMVHRLIDSDVLLVATPIIFTPSYSELIQPSGILKTIKDIGAFKAGTEGAALVQQLVDLGDRLIVVPGKRGLNAFAGTNLESVLRDAGITDLVLCGAVTSVCIDSTGRAGHERGFRVHILEDCTCGRTELEQQHYVSEIFPLYASSVTTGAEVGDQILAAQAGAAEDAYEVCSGSPASVATSVWNRQYSAEPSVGAQISERSSVDYLMFDRAWSRVTTSEDADHPLQEASPSPSGGVVSSLNVEVVKEWMRRNMDRASEIKDFQEEINIQIQHKLIDQAARMQRKLARLEHDATLGTPMAERGSMMMTKRKTADCAPKLTFLSHVKKEAASTARLLKIMFKMLVRKEELVPKIFLDSDDLVQLPLLLRQVISCDFLTVILTRSFFSRPWVMCELCTAFQHSVPIRSIQVASESLDIVEGLPLEPQVAPWLTEECMAIIKMNGFDRTTVLAAMQYALDAERFQFDPMASQAVQWKQVRCMAERMPNVSLSVPDPEVTYCSFEARFNRWSVYLSYHRGVDTPTAHVVKLLLQAALPEQNAVFLDTDNLIHSKSTFDAVRSSENVVLLLSDETLRQPSVVAEMVTASKAGVHMVPVPITRDFDISKYVGEEFYFSLSEEFDEAGKAFFREQNITFSEIAKSFRNLFTVIAEYFIPSSSEVVQQAAIRELCRRLHSPAAQPEPELPPSDRFHVLGER